MYWQQRPFCESDLVMRIRDQLRSLGIGRADACQPDASRLRTSRLAGDRSRSAWLAAPAIVILLAACAPGSGSSGLSERSAINRAQNSGRCVGFETVDYCPTDTEDVAPGGQEIDTPFDEGGVFIECFEVAPDEEVCDFFFSFIPSDFDEDVEILFASRPFESDGPWDIETDVDLTDVDDLEDPIGSGAPDFVPGDDDTDVQLAFVAVDAGARATIPEQVDTLGELGSDLAFVAPAIDVEAKPLPIEDDVIDAALASQSCVDGGLQHYCPNDKVFPACPPQPSIGGELFFYESHATIDLPTLAPIQCEVDGPTTCGFELTYRIDGLIELFYKIATRVVVDGEGGDWRIGPEVMEYPYDPDPEVERDIPVPAVVEIPDGFDRSDPDARLMIQVALMPDPIQLDESDVSDILALQGGFVIFISEVVEAEVVDP